LKQHTNSANSVKTTQGMWPCRVFIFQNFGKFQ